MWLDQTLRRIAGSLGIVTAALGALVLLGWFENTDPLAFLGLNAAPMKPAAAACLVIAGSSLCLQLCARVILRRVGVAIAFFALAIALATLVARWLNLDPCLDSLLARLLDVADGTGLRMSSHSALALSGLSLALIFLARKRGPKQWPISAWLANLVLGLSVAGLLAAEFATTNDFIRPLRFSSHLSIALLLLGVGTLLARPEDRHIRVLFAQSTAGMLARRLFIAVAVAPMCFSAALAWLVRHQHLLLGDSVVLFVAAVIVFGFGIALFSVEAAADINASREDAEHERRVLTTRLQEQAAQLQDTVSQRTRELREANASLRSAAESSDLLALVAQNTTSAVIIANAQGQIEWVNTAFTRLTGYELSEVKGRKRREVLEGRDTSAAASAMLRAAERIGEPCNVEIIHYTKDGAAFWHVVDLQPARDRSGQVVNLIANLTDITGQRADKTRLEQLNQRFELATRAANLGVWEWNAVSEQSTWDERTLEIYGLSAEEFNGTLEQWIQRIHPDDRDTVIDHVKAALATGYHYEHDFRILRASDGAERYVESRAIVQRDAQGKAVRVAGTERDVTSEREATRKTETLNKRLRLALRSSNFGVWEYDIVSGRRHWDDRTLEIFDIARDEFDETRPMWLERIHPEDRAVAAEHMRRVIAGELPEYAIHFRIVRPDASLRHVDSVGHLERDERGNAVRLVGLSRDVSEQKHMAQALDLAEQRWQLAIEGTNDSVWDWDLVTGEIFRDERWARMLGYSSDEIENTNAGWKALVHPDDLVANESAVREHFEQRTSFYQHELRIRAKDGSWRWILDRGKVVRRASDGRPLRMAGMHTDVTVRKQLEQRLQKSEELASEVSRLAQIGGWEIDLVTPQVTWTEGTRRIHDVDDTFQPTIESVWQFFPPDGLPIAKGALNDLEPTQPSFDIQLPLLTARGRRLWVRILGHGEFHHGKLTSVHGAIQDVTAQHESEETRRQLETQLFQAQKMETLGTLAGGIAHDFNNLLTGIIGYHELAADSLPSEHPSRVCLDEARNASLRARKLVDQILTFGRQSGADHDPIDLSGVVEEARRFLRSTLPANITIEVNCTLACGAVAADATRMHQVLLNLGSNAAHAMRQQGGTLRVSLQPANLTPELALSLGTTINNNYVRLSVSDTGHGMDESTRRRIFDPFFTTKNSQEGTGLGLAVVHGIVRSHGGTIDVESTPGQGSTFHIYLPRATEENVLMERTPDAVPRGGGEYVCVVDDEEVVGSCTKLVLENKGYRSLIFNSAEQCLAEVGSNPSRCTVLVTDQTMPGMQGTELAVKLRKAFPALPVVIMSGYFSKISAHALDELGQVELLAKPFTTDELAHAVHRALHSTSTLN
jgi:PAS domain S-box-containing protein